MPRCKHKPIPQLSDKDASRFWSKVDVRGPDECWPWKAGGSECGYGFFCMPPAVKGAGFRSENLMASRVAYVLQFGEDPGELQVCHSCDNPPCCNGRHLFLGTGKDNAQDRHQKGRGYPIWDLPLERHTRGERIGNARLNADAIRCIAIWYSAGIPQKVMAEMLGVTKAPISKVVQGKGWGWMGLKMVPPPVAL